MTTPSWLPNDIPLDKPSPARMYDYFLGGAHNFAIDRAAAEQVMTIMPDVPHIMQANRAFLRRAVTFLVQQGITQFLDIGSGMPTVGNVHTVAQTLDPTARVAYVDLDPLVVRQSEALLHGNTCALAVQADARHPQDILAHPQIQRLLNFDAPIGVLLVAVLHFVPDDAQAYNLVQVVRDALPKGSYLVLTHGTNDGVARDLIAQNERLYARTTTPAKTRPHAHIEQFFDGFTLVGPGLVYVPLWHPESPDDLFLDDPARSCNFGGVGLKQ